MFESRPLAGLASILVLVAVLGAVAAFGFSNTDLANNITNSAEARAKDEQTKIDTEKAAIDLELYRQKTQAETEQIRIALEKQQEQAKIDLVQMQDNYQIESEIQRIRAKQQLELERLAWLSVLGILILLTVALISGLGYRFFRREQIQLKSITSESDKTHLGKPMNDYNNLEWKRQMIRLARQREQETRIFVGLQKIRVAHYPNVNSSSIREENRSSKNLPLAK